MLRLVLERNRRNMNGAQLARAARLDQSLLYRIQSGHAKPYPGELARIAEALGVPEGEADKLLEDIGEVSAA